ncbi:ABC transporter substrate-binding protein [Piscibacillus halophilus]|uniref:ABC transporter substrate-binding protein n=1 Tax=Piscibacillus halophilus TaxID=571933 RepID=UPI00158C2958|nr:ABC transporter substrate-binding protein [Piscibacillus halophilus]
MKHIKKVAWLLSVVMFLSLLAACNTEGEEGSSGETQEVSIGYSGPLSGPAAYYGEATFTGLELAVEEINEAGGFDVDGQNYTIDLVSLDDQYLPNEAASNAQRLVEENDVSVVYTPHSGGIMAQQVLNEQEEFMIMAYSSEPAITEQGNSLTVAIPPRYDGYIAPFTEYAMENHGNKIALLPTSSQYGKDWNERLEPYWQEQGGEVVFNSSIDFNKDTDFFTILTNALENDPDVIFIGGPSQPTAKVAQQARELGFEGGFIIMDQAKLDEMKDVTGTYETFEGSVGVNPLQYSDYPGTAEFLEKYQEEFDKVPGSEAGFHYISAYILVEAMKAAGTVDDAHAIREHMQQGIEALPEDKKVYDIPGILDEGNFDVIQSMAVVENGEVVPVDID